MTRAYDDIEAVTRLLEEKEKDLELTVQIGKELLTQNNLLETRIIELDNELKISNDDRSQLLHELHKKNELISVLTNDDGSEVETSILSKSISVDLLQKKITALQDENKSLKQEASQLAIETDDVEAQERKLLHDLTAQINDASGQYESLNLDLERYREENRLQHEQIVSLTARLSEAEMRLHQLTSDNDEHLTLLNITKENQNSLALELVEFKKRYQEVCSLLQEAQDQLRKQRKRIMPQVRTSFPIFASGISNNCLQAESLQSELMEVSMCSENSIDSGIIGDHSLNKTRMSISQPNGNTINRSSYKRVFDTVRNATNVGIWTDALSIVESVSSSIQRMNVGTVATGSYVDMNDPKLSFESFLSSDLEDSYPSQPAGVPGAPGAKDLEQALKRLSPAEILARRAVLSYDSEDGSINDDKLNKFSKNAKLINFGLRTPDSIMSTGSSGISLHGSMTSQQWRLPEKLQIVKPLEGSQTLHHWTRLATPSMEGVLEDRPGVAVRGGRNIEDLRMQSYTLSDVEEDMVCEDLPIKQFNDAGCTYTFTTSVVMHPADDAFPYDFTFMSQSQISSRMGSSSTSRQPSCPPTPGLSRKNSCSTFSVNLGLASMLHERGIKAVTPSAINTPAGPNFTPTLTPCNSPEGSPIRCMSPEPLFSGLISSGADLVRRKLIGVDIKRHGHHKDKIKQQKIMLSRLERRALRSLKLVEKVESIGLENIIAASNPCYSTTLASHACSGGVIDRSNSPLIHHRQLQSNDDNKVDELQFDRKQIKVVLHKALVFGNKDISDDSDDDAGLIMHSFSSGETKKSITILESNATSMPSISEPITLPSVTDTRIKQMQRQKSRRHIKNGSAIKQRTDLGTIASDGIMRNDLGKVVLNVTSTCSKNTCDKKEEKPAAPQSITQAFVGSVGSLIFGRKGGWF